MLKGSDDWNDWDAAGINKETINDG